MVCEEALHSSPWRRSCSAHYGRKDQYLSKGIVLHARSVARRSSARICIPCPTSLLLPGTSRLAPWTFSVQVSSKLLRHLYSVVKTCQIESNHPIPYFGNLTINKLGRGGCKKSCYKSTTLYSMHNMRILIIHASSPAHLAKPSHLLLSLNRSSYYSHPHSHPPPPAYPYPGTASSASACASAA